MNIGLSQNQFFVAIKSKASQAIKLWSKINEYHYKATDVMEKNMAWFFKGEENFLICKITNIQI